MKQITIIDYGSGNLHSIAKAFEHEAGDMKIIISNKTEDIERASHIVLPGVGAFGDCVKGLESLEGVKDALTKAVMKDKKPFMGVCVGMQMLADIGTEHENHNGLGWIKGKVIAIDAKEGLKIPHMGWNELKITKDHPIFEGINSGDHVYFVHSYQFMCDDSNNIISTTEYGNNITAAIANDNIIATQFHPEKSQHVGLKLISNFLKM